MWCCASLPWGRAKDKKRITWNFVPNNNSSINGSANSSADDSGVSGSGVSGSGVRSSSGATNTGISDLLNRIQSDGLEINLNTRS